MRKEYTFERDLKKRLKNPAFKKVWDESEVEYQLACQLIEKRLANKMSQRTLAKKAMTTQTVICQIENMDANPTITLLQKIAKALNTDLKISLK